MAIKNTWQNGDAWNASDANDVANAVNAAYTKPGTGIPKSDLASGVQSSLDKADTAVQSVSSTSISDATVTGKSLITTADPAAARTTLGVAYGTSAGTVAQGDDSRITGAQQVSERGQANGYAPLDSAGKISVSFLPSSVMTYMGTYNATTNTPALADGTGDAGDTYRVSVAGTRNFGSGNITLRVGDYVIYSGSVYQKSATTDNVASVAGKTGDVTLTAPDVSGVEATANKGAASGYCGLDANSKVAIGNLPTGTTSSTVCIGNDSRLSDARTPTAAGQVADMSIVCAAAGTTRAVGTNDFPFGVKVQRDLVLSSVTYRVATADASGSMTVELRKNGSTLTGSAATVAFGSQVAGGTATGSWSLAAGDVLTVYITAVGGSPGKGLCADIKGLTS